MLPFPLTRLYKIFTIYEPVDGSAVHATLHDAPVSLCLLDTTPLWQLDPDRYRPVTCSNCLRELWRIKRKYYSDDK
jgi:hypothetical protein